MGLLLSVLVVCVGVLEVLACVRHFQDGYLPLWTPHCAVTSGYTASYERWRKKPSDSCEFRSFDDVNGALYAAEKDVSENCLAVYSNIQNGFPGKQDEKENIYPIDLHYQQLKSCSGNGLSPSIDDLRKEVLSSHSVTDVLSSSFEPDKCELKCINKNTASAIPSESIPTVPECCRNTKDAVTAEISADLPSDNDTVNVCPQYRVLIPHTQSESVDPLTDRELERIFSHNNGIEKYSISDEEIGIEDEGPVLNVSDESFTSPCGAIGEGNSERDSSDRVPGGKKPTRNENGSRLEELLEISSSVLCGENALDRVLRDTAFSAVVKPDSHVSASVTELSISSSDSIVERNSNTVAGHDRWPSRRTESLVPSSDSVVDNFTSNVLNLENQIQHASSEVLIPSHLQTHEDKRIMGFVERDPSSTAGDMFDKPDGTVSNSRNESVGSACLNSGHGSQNSFVPHLSSEETFITPSTVSSQYNTRISVDGLESDHTAACEQPVSLPESLDARKELADWCTETESGICFSTEFAEQLSAGFHRETEASNSKWDDSFSAYDTESGAGMQHSPLVSEDENTRNITFEERRINETGVSPDEVGTGTKHDVLDPIMAREPFSSDIQNEEEIRITSEDAEEHVSESCLDSQTILPDSVVSRDEGTPHDIYFPAADDLKEDIVHGESSDIPVSSDISAPPLAISSAPVPPLSINTSLETRVPVTPLPTDHQISISPPKVPSTPKRSKADISWPVFFPGTPVIKRPSVSFATPESVCANDEFLRHCAEEFPDLQGIKIPDDNSTAAVSESTESTSEGRLLASSVATSEGSDSLEEPDPIVYREKSPSNIVSGNDFSRKELKLHRRKSYKQKRYNSAVEIRTHDEEAEERSFSENNPGLIRASSVKEPKKRYKQPAKSSSFEDALLPDIKTDGVGEECLTNTAENTSAVSVPEGKETEREGTQLDQENFEETKETSDITHCLTISTERNESKSDEPKPQQEEKWTEENATGGQKEDSRGDDDEEYSYSEEQSSSQQKSPPKEAFWVSREDGTH